MLRFHKLKNEAFLIHIESDMREIKVSKSDQIIRRNVCR